MYYQSVKLRVFLQFLKSEADLEYIEKRLKLDFINSTAENGCPAEVVTLHIFTQLKTGPI